MSVHSRQTKVFAALLVSITVGAIILKALGNNPPSAGAFCLSRYYRLDPVEKCILSRTAKYPQRWSHIEIYYSDTKAGGTGNKTDTANKYINCHFVICNGRIGCDGQILPTEIWQRQHCPHQLHQSGQSQTGSSQRFIGGGQLVWGQTPACHSEQTIYISVMTDNKATRPTDLQIKRTEALVEGLSRKFDIRPESIHYPDNWQ